MKITDMFISAIIKKGILYEARNCDMEFEVPMSTLSSEEDDEYTNSVMIRFKADHMTLRIEKSDK